MLAQHRPTYRALARCGMDELAHHQLTAKASGGVLFARKKERGEKDEARRYIVDMLGDTIRFPQLSMLTLPGVDWKFENKLLGRREGDWARRMDEGPRCTHIHAIENDRAIYHAGLTRMPGMLRPEWANARSQRPNAPLTVHRHTTFAERVVGNVWVERYFFGNVDDLMRAPPQQYDAAWLDYTGPLSIERMAVIRSFFDTSVRSVLFVTALRARWSRATSDAIQAAGSHSGWFWDLMGGHQVHELEYQDGPSPMTQFAVSKERIAP